MLRECLQLLDSEQQLDSIVIGITGHRDLRPCDIPCLEKRLHDLFHEIHELRPEAAITLVSPLAEGADRLVARVALSNGAKLVVMLPMQENEYERDFETTQSLNEFRELSKRATAVYTIPFLPSTADENVRGWGEPRAKQYAYVGAYVCDASHILLALWDGEASQLSGGTAEVVKFKCKGIPKVYKPTIRFLPHVTSNIVYHIVTPRISHPETEDAAFSLHLLRG